MNKLNTLNTRTKHPVSSWFFIPITVHELASLYITYGMGIDAKREAERLVCAQLWPPSRLLISFYSIWKLPYKESCILKSLN